ncbi:MAG: methionyl-tRNA formyltransferase [Corynebacteriales bacterium]|nr:methionyl-tRNA formyltransferase [Mycobacteriales bacterium]
MRLVFAGTPQVALPALRALIDSPHDIAAVVTRPDAPAGRGRKLVPSPVRELAEQHGIEVLTPAKASDPVFLARLEEINPDCCPVVAYGALLPKSALAIPRLGWINLHFSILPAWRGAAPVQAAIWHGDEFTGASVFQIEEGLDTGPVFGMLTEPIASTDTAGELLDRLAESGAGLLRQCVDGLATSSLHAAPQPAEGVSHAPKIKPEDARVNWTLPAFAVDRRIRACTPAPGAWTLLNDARLRLGPVKPTEEHLSPGELRIERRRVLVGTATTAVQLGDVQPQGKKVMPATDWARGARLNPMEKFDV